MLICLLKHSQVNPLFALLLSQSLGILFLQLSVDLSTPRGLVAVGLGLYRFINGDSRKRIRLLGTYRESSVLLAKGSLSVVARLLALLLSSESVGNGSLILYNGD
jgi:hypothetical protein